MRTSRFVAAASSAATIIAAFAVHVPLSAAASRAATVRIAGTASPVAARSPRISAVAAGTRIDFEVELKLPDHQGAEAFARSVSSPGSSSYGQYLTPAQWEQRFSPTAAQVAAVSRFLRQSGFLRLAPSADRMAIDASGTAAQIEKAFGTALSYHRVHGVAVRLADSNLAVPTALAAVVAGVTGLSQTLAHPDNTTGNPARTPAATTPAATTPSATPSRATPSYAQPAGFRVSQPCGSYYGEKVDNALTPFGQGYPSPAPWAVCGYTPPQFRSAYGLTGSSDGSGVTVAVVDAYVSPTLFSDAHEYAAINDPANPLTSSQFSERQPLFFDQGGPNQCGASGWFGEQTLDVEAVHGTAPGAHILYAGARNCGADALNQAVREIVDGHLAQVITNSYGDNGGDVLDSVSTRVAVDNVLIMAAGTGVSVLFSSGDNGDEYTTLGSATADYPPSSPWATAVGGTSLQIGANGQRVGEFGWSTARSFYCNQTYVTAGGCTSAQLGTWGPIDQTLDGGSGGGTSVVYSQPFYQAGVVPIALSERNGAQPMRVEPDISMEADPATGMLVGETQTFPTGVYYGQYRIGGTSVASPLFAGVIARADSAAGQSLGFLNPRLYALYGHAGALYDVLPAGKQDMSRSDYANSLNPSQGFLFSTRIIDYEGPDMYCPTTGPCTSSTVSLSSTPGFDSMTGLGAPGASFVTALSGP